MSAFLDTALDPATLERAPAPAGPAASRSRRDGMLSSIEHAMSLTDQLRSLPTAEQLWRRRVGAMNSLVQLRYVEAQRIDM
jgi:hypothetical protein